MNSKFIKSFGCAIVVTMLCLAPFASAQDAGTATQQKKEEKKKWDVLNPPFDLSTVQIDTDETTWSSLDISPDGKNFVFDMLGDIYIVDMTGGEARALTQDFAWNIHPAISPDGQQIAFISDRDGISEHIEAMGLTVDYVGTIISNYIKEGYVPMVF